MLAQAVASLFAGRYIHAGLSYRGCVCSVEPGSVTWFAHLEYLSIRPEAMRVYRVELARPIDIEGVAHIDPHTIIDGVLSRMTRGRWRSGDCVQTTVNQLRSGGVMVPRHITTPAKLGRWLEDQGHAPITLAAALASPSSHRNSD